MSAISRIEWTDRTWNPIRGCSVVSPGCVNCYAMKQAHRFSGEGRAYEGLTKQTKAGPQWTGKVRTVESALLAPLSWQKPARVFVNSMSDLFHEGVPDEFIDQVFAVMALAPQHTFQILTKRADRMREYFTDLPYRTAQIGCDLEALGYSAFASGFGVDPPMAPRHPLPLPNVWLGVSAEDQKRAGERIPRLLQTPAAVRFVSAEPLLGPIDFRKTHLHGPVPSEIDWVIVGGESGPGARPCDLRWIERIVSDCEDAEVPVFVKQVGSRAYVSPAHDGATGYEVSISDRKGGNPSDWPAALQVREFPCVEARA